jgi:hypothetical protein
MSVAARRAAAEETERRVIETCSPFEFGGIRAEGPRGLVERAASCAAVYQIERP